jgi:radical SAM superfamily enzyme YgiQ (UPF0313 family)
MNILLVHAEFPPTYWSFHYALPIAGARAALPPLGLATVAAHLPQAWQLRLIDLNVRALADADLRWADAVLVGGMLVQAESMREVLRRARALGVRTVAGGPAPTSVPEQFADADVIFGGEVEGRADQLIAAITGTGRVRIPLDRNALPDVRLAPVPRFDLYEPGAYASTSVQYSRGCPFHCEFCDVIQLFGQVPRVKTPAQVLAELDALHAHGWRGSVFIVDDNFIGNLKEVRKLVPELTAWQRVHGNPFDFYTEASVNLAREPELLTALVGAGFTSVFVGIETPDAAALAHTGKKQNLRLDLREAVDRLSAAGLEVMAGFIVGFDTDGPGACAAQWQFLANAPIPFAMVGLLQALPGTALSRRLQREGRLRGEPAGGDPFGRPNFDPIMDEATMLAGYAELLARVYTPENYVRRCLAFLERAPRAGTPGTQLQPHRVAVLMRAIWMLGIRSPRRRHFWHLLGATLRRSPRRFTWAVSRAIQGEHLIRYTAEDVLPRMRRALSAIPRVDRRAPAAALG